jgi:hypothetical protein
VKKAETIADVAKKFAKSRKSTVTSPLPGLVIEACFGLKASIDDGYLKIEQSDDAGNTDTLMLSRAEVRQLIAQFSDWARQ